jgi:alkyl hydroperoxide reductase subunit AhpC
LRKLSLGIAHLELDAADATLPVWAQFADSAARIRGRHAQILGVSLDSLQQTRRYAAQNHIRYPLVTFPNEKIRRLYRAGSVPQTVVLDAGGLVLYAHVGRLENGPALDSLYTTIRKGGALAEMVGQSTEIGATALGRRP